MAESAPATPAAAVPAAPSSEPVLVATTTAPVEPKLTEDIKGVPSDPNPEYEYDKRLYTEDGKFNKDGAKEFLTEVKKKEEHYEKRILDLRRKVSDGKAPDKPEEYFLDYAPVEKFMPLFDPKAPSAPEIENIKGLLAKQYHDSALTKRQAEDMTNVILHVLESVDVIDTKTQDQKYAEKGRWVEEQKKQLGSNADNIIREAKLWVETTSVFTAKAKNMLLNLMNEKGADAIDAIHQLKDAYGGSGSIPASVGALAGLPSDAELKREYFDKGTTDFRRQEIIALRAKSGRTTRLMDASF